LKLIASGHVVVISLDYISYFVLDIGDPFVIGPSVGVLSLPVEPLPLLVHEINDLFLLVLFDELLVTSIDPFDPAVRERLKFILTLIGLDD
jgi:hypothetical protein